MENYNQQQKNRYFNFFLNIYKMYNEKVSVRKFIELLLTLGAIVVFSLFAIKPTSITIIGLVKEIGEKQKTIVALDQKIDNLRVGQSEFAQLVSYSDIINNALASEAPITNLVQYVERLAGENNVTASVKVGKVGWIGKIPSGTNALSLDKELVDQAYKFDAGLDYFAATIEARGGYLESANFIRAISTAKMPMIVDKANLTYQEETGVSVTLEVRVPYLKNADQS